MNIILPESMDAPTIPETFMRGLRALDPALVIYWNRFKHRFVVDRCILGHDVHGPSCQRANVLIVETPEGLFMMPNDWTLDKIKAMDAWTNYGTLENQRRTRENAKADWDAKRHEATREAFKEAAIDNKSQINEALTLIKTHDLHHIH